MTRLRGRARRGQRLKMKAPFGHWGTQTFIAALRHDHLPHPVISSLTADLLPAEFKLASTLMPFYLSGSTTSPGLLGTDL